MLPMTLREIFGDGPVCKHAGTQFDPAGGHDVVCTKYRYGAMFCYSKCCGYEPPDDIQNDEKRNNGKV